MIEFKNVSKVYPGNVHALKDANLTIQDGEFVCFIGTSGSGKTTALRMINRMHDPSEGEILIDGQATTSMNAVDMRRKIGYVIQRIGLMPHMTVYENIVTVPRLLKWDEDRCRTEAEKLMKRVELPLDYLDRYPSELSGGQQQRIGVIRALVANPKIVLMDEPFGALDPITRDALQELVKELQREYHNTFIFVTHDMDEALNLADRIAIWDKGNLLQYDTPEEILRHPADDYVKSFLGEDRLFEAKTQYIQVKDVMNDKPLSISMGQSLSDALTLMRDSHVDSLFVVDDRKRLKGQISIENIMNARDMEASVSDEMVRRRGVQEDALVQDTIQRILKAKVQNVAVVNREGQLTGIVTRSNLVNIVYEVIWGETKAIEGVEI
ncbi:ABC transporter ATP-binding protein [Aerococcus sanguinicola]|uniref:ABC transporter ATP-binding protein n=1 Tax=unclassified Aerococcus TaxID=2618060 RepID=UPI0008A1BDD4|nr:MULTISPECIES: ABC transporter ATP-binding protein [unclassified Aerococcus]KAB0646234.1 betaine/proline/choline family ABC transporter ATP-binding protein [Aerococcus sanguinicola]MDK6234074.1 ABC transporter ATP-binding protein [Aerococcus sp. UMB10185]MDK6856256.1 ABC transporter ATP-binding protein [Aerococcus sp. UMB7533]MDK8503108.1 ABC transporter ATP-binding protein [Aerococcus sp. UMB1112A]OFN01100.1 glycine/betaine ABC transporter ATP-binding protein [Aerococcus sp. HMSC062A02]